MEGSTFFYIGIVLVIAALIVAAVGLRSNRFPTSTAAMAGVIGVFVVLVAGTTTFAVVKAREEQSERTEQEAVEQKKAEGAAGLQGETESRGTEGAANQATLVEQGGELFESEGCSGCHTLKAAGSTATTGPDLDQVLASEDVEFITKSIEDPSAFIAKGYQDGIMPQNYGETLSPEELDALATYLADSTGAKQ